VPRSNDETSTEAQQNPADYRNHAGTVLWPNGPTQLSDTTACPACFTPLSTTRCLSCGLDLAHPLAAELAAVSDQAVSRLDQRLQLIGRIRYETAQTAVTITPTVTPTTTPSITQTVTQTITPPAAAEPPRSSAPPAPAPRRSSVQVALLIAAVSLLSVFAIFFLVYAFINYGMVWRSVIIAGITVAAFAAATVLRRRTLTASAEALAVFALVLVYLDAYALRENDFFGLSAMSGPSYWGATLVIAGVAFVTWHRLSAVRAASVVGWPTIAPGLALLAWGAGSELEVGTRTVLSLALWSLGGLLHTFIAHGTFRGTIERMLVLGSSSLALVWAFAAAWFAEPDTVWAGTLACIAVAGVGAVLTVSTTLQRTASPGSHRFGLVFATTAGVATAAAIAAGTVRVDHHYPLLTIAAPLLAAGVTTLALEAAAGQAPRQSRLARAARYSAAGGLGVLGLTSIVPVSLAVSPVVGALARTITIPWEASATQLSLSDVARDSGIAVIALAGLVALAAASWSLGGHMHRRATILASGTTAVLTLAATQLPNLWSTLAAWAAIAIASYLTLLLRPHAPAGLRACLATTLGASTALLYLVGWASLDTWALTTVATIALAVGSRALTRSIPARASMLGVAIAVALHGVGAVAAHAATFGETTRLGEVTNGTTLVALAGILLLAASALFWHASVSTTDRRVSYWMGITVTSIAATVLWVMLDRAAGMPVAGLLLPQPVTSLVASVLAVAALVCWVGMRANSALPAERITSSVALGPAIYWVCDSLARVAALPPAARDVVPITAALVAAAGAITVTLLRPSTAPRWSRELGVALVGVPGVLIAVITGSPGAWLVLLFAAVTLLLTAIDRDGLFSSRSRRRHLGWGALALATAGLWLRLSSDQVQAIEPYVLPVGGALLVIAALVHRASARRVEEQKPGLTHAGPASLIALAGLLVAIVPIAADAITGDPVRAAVITAVSVVLVIVGSFAPADGSWRPYLDMAALAGAIGAVVTPIGRALNASPAELTRDTWLIAMVLALLIAAFGQARLRSGTPERWRSLASQTLGMVAIAAFTLIEATGFSDATLGPTRAIATVFLLSALHVASHAIDHAPFTRPLSLLAIALAGTAAAIAMVADTVEPIELLSVPIALALLVSGARRLAERAESRSWATLAPGILVLLLPTLLANSSSPELWRLVGLGVASVTVLIVGAVRRLQSPFLIGLVVTLIHGFSTFAPQIRAVYESYEWWAWAGLAGLTLLLLAIRYERRIQNLKDVVMRIAAMR
jgi:hypothetical protein